MQDHIKGLEAQLDEFVCPSFAHQSHHSITKVYQIGMIFPWWSHAGCLGSPAHPSSAITSFHKDLFHDIPRHRGDVHQSVVPQVFLSIFLKNRSDISFFPVTRDFAWQPSIFKYDGAGWHIGQFLPDPEMHIIQPHRLVHIQVLRGDLWLALLLQWEGYCYPNLHLEVQGHERHRKPDSQGSLSLWTQDL